MTGHPRLQHHPPTPLRATSSTQIVIEASRRWHRHPVLPEPAARRLRMPRFTRAYSASFTRSHKHPFADGCSRHAEQLRTPPGAAPDQGGQVMCALTAVAFPAVTVAVATPGWQPGRLAVTV